MTTQTKPEKIKIRSKAGQHADAAVVGDVQGGAVLKNLIHKDANLVRLLIMLVIVFILVSILQPQNFLNGGNFISMSTQFPEYGILAIGISLTMITGGIDLSVVGIADLSAILAAKFMMATIHDSTPPAATVLLVLGGILIAFATGFAAGAFNGFCVSKIGIPAILATLGSMQLFTGIAIGITDGKPQSGLPMLFSDIGNAQLFNCLPVPFLLFVAVVVIMGIVVSRTKYGTQLYLLGTNEKAALFSGISNTRVLMRTYILSGVLSALAGLIMMARSNSAKANYGTSYTLQCVLIAVMGGVDPNGGTGNIAGVTVAVLILQILSSGLSMFDNISNFYRDVIWGTVLVLVLIFNFVINNRRSKKAVQN